MQVVPWFQGQVHGGLYAADELFRRIGGPDDSHFNR